MLESYPEIQLDALGELANIGSGNAATALSSMLGRPVDISLPMALALPIADAVEAAGAPDAVVTAVALPLVGDLEAIALLLFTAQDSRALCGLLGVEVDSEVGISALAEIGNILGTSYVGALSQMTGLALEPRPPETTTDMLGAVVSSVLVSSVQETDIVLLLDSKLSVGGSECSLSFILAPGQGGVEKILARLGLTR
jgi:chemotaxis protein CheC